MQLIGWLGNCFYFSRFAVQWLASEKAGRSVAPRSFWWLSLLGAACLIAYTLEQGEPVLLFGFLVTVGVYGRNLWVSRPGYRGKGLSPIATVAIAVPVWLVALWIEFHRGGGRLPDSPLWMFVAIGGQSLWTSRFIVQWWLTERRGYSHFPLAFWWISLGGNGLLLAYACSLGDPVWIAGLVPGPLIQTRNLVLSYRAARGGAATA